MIKALQRRLESIAERVRGRLGFFVCSRAGDVWASYRAEETFAAASLIKVPILAAVGAEVDAKRLDWGTLVPSVHQDRAGDSGLIQYLTPLPYTVKDLAILMIAVSDNRATNALLDLVGWDNVNRYIKSRGWHETVVMRRLGDFAARARGLENFSSPRDLGCCLLGLLQGTLLTPSSTEFCVQALRAQVYRDGLRGGLPRSARVANKTGDMPGVEGDAAILWLRDGPVVAVVIANDIVDDLEARGAVQDIGRLVAETGGGCT
jgi:beta-lactamase class A